MSSIGVFHKVEMDGKPCFVHTLTQTDNSTFSGETLAMDSGGNDIPLQPLFVCPAARFKFLKLKLNKKDDDDNLFELNPYNSSPYFPTTRSGQFLLNSDRRHGICKLPLVPLFWCNNKIPIRLEFECGACCHSMPSESYYACPQCQRFFHKECVESPVEIIHPSHPFHSLRIYNCPTLLQSCALCECLIFDIFYRCTTCDLGMHPVCAMNPMPFIIENPKSHPHPLTFFPTQASTICNICGMIKKFDPTYICIQCVFVIHKNCIDYPHVIRISRHPHRISFTSSLPLGKLPCGICRRQVDNNYGAYSCNKCDSYFVHSKCALHPNVWDGKDLDGVPEEDDMIDDGEPFERIADGIILHPFHSHHLRLEIFKVYDENKYCRGCALPVYEGQFYSCIKCKFILHESCAHAPCMKRHPLHPHPLTLHVATKKHEGYNHMEGMIRCDVCNRYSTGFYYEHRIGEESFQLDLRCAMIIEPFEYQGHKHPLFLASDPYEEARCQMCTYESSIPKLCCVECDYIICYWCATFPYKARYKHDRHFLMICNGKEASDQLDWCEICERKLHKEYPDSLVEKGFYKCSDCCTVLHVECLLGVDINIKPRELVENEWTGVFLNNSLTRPKCNGCMSRCPYPVFFRRHNKTFCSYTCDN